MQKPSYNSQHYDWYDRWWHPGTACPSYYTDKTTPIHPMFPNPLDHPVVDKWTQDELMRCHTQEHEKYSGWRTGGSGHKITSIEEWTRH
jgi:hypothetical protein